MSGLDSQGIIEYAKEISKLRDKKKKSEDQNAEKCYLKAGHWTKGEEPEKTKKEKGNTTKI